MRQALILMLGLAACAPNVNNGMWVGDVIPRHPGPACEKTQGVAQIQGDSLTFTPNQATWILTGTAESDGRLTAEKIQLGANKQPFETRFEGRRGVQSITGTYTTPRCTSDVTLTRR